MIDEPSEQGGSFHNFMVPNVELLKLAFVTFWWPSSCNRLIDRASWRCTFKSKGFVRHSTWGHHSPS